MPARRAARPRAPDRDHRGGTGLERRSIESVVRALNEAGVRYLIAGGLAVVAHGHVRFTADLDLVIDLEPGNAKRAVAALAALGYAPRAPVAFAEFENAERRRQWALEKGMTVFAAASPDHPVTEVDLFVEPPFDFAPAYARAARLEVAPGLTATFVGLEDLIAMKRRAGRPVDRQDVEQLEALRDRRGAGL